jgi:hypothetical protein
MSKFFIHKDDQQQGPFTTDELKDLKIRRETMVWFEGADDWKKAIEIEELKEIFKSIPPPLIDIKTEDETKPTSEAKSPSKNNEMIVVILAVLLVGGLGYYIYTNEQAKQVEMLRQIEEQKIKIQELAGIEDQKLLEEQAEIKQQELEDKEIERIKSLIALFKKKDIDGISNKVSYPLYRQYPIPHIKDKEEFIKRFSEVFDQILIDKIANSEISQWSEVGWRGIMLDNGDLWIDTDGVITSVNYQTGFEKNLITSLIANEKGNLHTSLKTFKSPIYKIKTKIYLIRIDEVTDYNYRYAAWKVDEKETSKPDLVLNNGQIEYQGSGGNHVITFVNGIYTYKIYRNVIGTDTSSDITLEVEENGKIILKTDGTLIIE